LRYAEAISRSRSDCDFPVGCPCLVSGDTRALPPWNDFHRDVDLPDPPTPLLRRRKRDITMKRSSWRWPNDRNPNNWSEYEEVVTVYLLRAYKDEPHREAWVQQALSYIDKMVSLAPSEPANLYSSAYNYERAGDLSKNGCPSYEKAAIIVREFEFVTEGRQSHGRGLEVSNQAASARERGLSKRLTTKIESWCITTGSPSGLH
jgi:hypothetical protein